MIHAINDNAHWPKITFQHKLTISRLHDKNAYSDEKEPKRKKESREELKRETKRKKLKRK